MSFHRQACSASIPVALALSFALVSCAVSPSPPAQSGPAGSAAPSAPATTSAPLVTDTSSAAASPSSTAPTASGSTTAALSTFSGTWADVQYAFDYPADWDVQGQAPGSGEVKVISPDGTSLVSLTILIAWGAECPPCVERPVVHLGDVPGDKPLSKSGPFVARTLAMDLTGYPQDRAENVWSDNVRLVTSLNMNTEPVPAVMMPQLLHGLGLVETGVVASNGITHRTIIFGASRGFATLQEAEAYAASDEHRKIQEIIASFREGTA